MSQTAPQGGEPPQSSRRFWLVLLSRPVLGTLLVLLALVAVGCWRLLVFIEEDLAPLISRELSDSLNRPVEVGNLEQYSLTGMRFGPSGLPAYETQVDGKTVIDKDIATTEGVDVSFDVWKTITTRTLNLDVTLVEPQLSVDEDAEGRWLLTELDEEDEDSDPPVKIQLDTLRVQNGQAVINPFGAATRIVQDLDGAIAIGEERIGVKGSGELDSGGTARVDGEWRQANESLKLNLKAKDLAVVPLLGFIPGELPVQIRAGAVDGNFDLEYQPQQPIKFTGKTNIAGADIRVPEQDIQVKARRVKSNFRVAYTENQLPKIGGQAEFQGADLAVPEKLIFQNGRSQPQRLNNTIGQLKFIEDEQRIQFEARGNLGSGGRLRTRGVTSLDLEDINVLLLARNISAPILDGAFDLPLQVKSGQVDANLNLQLRADALPNVRGIARMRKIDAQIEGLPKSFYDANGFVRFPGGLTTSLEGVTARYDQVPLEAKGTIDVKKGYNITAQTIPVEVDTALNTLGIGPETLPFGIVGKIRVPELRVTGAIDKPLISGQVAASEGTTIDRVPFERVKAQFRLDAPLIQVNKIDARPKAGGTITGQAQYDLTPGSEVDANLFARNVPGDTIAQLYVPDVPSDITVGPVFAQVNLSGQPEDIRTKVDFQARQAAYSPVGPVSTAGTLRLRSGIVVLDNIVAQVADGTARFTGQVKDQRLQGNIKVASVAINNLSQEVQGALDGSVDLTVPFTPFSTETIRADGNLRVSGLRLAAQGLSPFEGPLDAAVGWNGRQILVKDASAPGFRANGAITANFQDLQKSRLGFNVFARNYDLRPLSASLPTAFPVKGHVDLTGHLTGTPTQDGINLRSTVAFKNLAVSQLAFEPKLRGKLNYNQGLDLNVQGNSDRIQAALVAPNWRPKSFLVKRDDAIAKGISQGDLFLANVQQLPLQLVPFTAFLPLPKGIGQISGIASGDFQTNFRDFQGDWTMLPLKGSVAINKPGIGELRGDRLTGDIRYVDGVVSLSNTALLRGESQYLLDATATLSDVPKYSGQLKIARGQIADVVAAGQVLSNLSTADTTKPAKYGTATDVQTLAVGNPSTSLQVQMQRLAEIEQLLAQEKAAQEAAAPNFDIAKLTGQFGGEISLSGSGLDLLGVESGAFDLQGQNFTLGDYRVEQVVATGGLEGDTLRVDPIKLATGDRQATFTGQIGLEEQTGELIVRNIPIDPINQFVTLPAEATGTLNGKANLSGSIFDPQIDGQFRLVDASLGETPITKAEVDLNYQEARLRFESIAQLDNPEPLLISGNIPYPLGFAVPDSDQIAITAKVKNEGLGLVSLATDQVGWIDGEGAVDVQVRGTLEQPLFQGTVALKDAKLSSAVLQDSLTNVTGSLKFNNDWVTIPSLEGTYNQGAISAAGQLSLLDPDAVPPQPLMVGINGLDVAVEGLYKGGVTGQVTVTGAAVKPTIGGRVQLSDGQVLLAKAAGGSTTAEEAEAIVTGNQSADDGARRYVPISELGTTDQPLSLNNLELQLLEDVRVTQAPVLSFVSSGNLLVDGPANAPRVDGRIRFREGTINLITSRFRVDPRRDSYAEFNSQYGLDPYLNIAMRTTVTEVTQAKATDLNEAEEVPASSLGAFQSVRVQATVDGRASELISNFRDVVEVSSSPRRSEGEIIALLGGGVTDAVQQGQAQAAAVNLAGSAALSEVQGVFDGLLGSRASFRAFPVLLPDANEGQASVLSLGAELGYDVTDRFSVSVLQVLTGVDEPTLVNLSYDINRNITARTSVSTRGEAVGALEFRLRF